MRAYDVTFKCSVYVQAPNLIDAALTAMEQLDAGGWEGAREFLSIDDATLKNSDDINEENIEVKKLDADKRHLLENEQRCPVCKTPLAGEFIGAARYLDCSKCKISFKRRFNQDTGKFLDDSDWEVDKTRLH
jgi:hypothetical protein